ncbi:hypothetical protein [Microbispora sp. NPDC049633]|uniref:hypothetical protein n=1 Tax=Microbispora sp. NPDC049633 TaxID=3154355 RepID=UPI003445E216
MITVDMDGEDFAKLVSPPLLWSDDRATWEEQVESGRFEGAGEGGPSLDWRLAYWLDQVDEKGWTTAILLKAFLKHHGHGFEIVRDVWQEDEGLPLVLLTNYATEEGARDIAEIDAQTPADYTITYVRICQEHDRAEEFDQFTVHAKRKVAVSHFWAESGEAPGQTAKFVDIVPAAEATDTPVFEVVWQYRVGDQLRPMDTRYVRATSADAALSEFWAELNLEHEKANILQVVEVSRAEDEEEHTHADHEPLQKFTVRYTYTDHGDRKVIGYHTVKSQPGKVLETFWAETEFSRDIVTVTGYNPATGDE